MMKILDFIMQMHTCWYFHIYMPHTHLYTNNIIVCIDFCILDHTYIIDIVEKCNYSYTASAFCF